MNVYNGTRKYRGVRVKILMIVEPPSPVSRRTCTLPIWLENDWQNRQSRSKNNNNKNYIAPAKKQNTFNPLTPRSLLSKNYINGWQKIAQRITNVAQFDVLLYLLKQNVPVRESRGSPKCGIFRPVKNCVGTKSDKNKPDSLHKKGHIWGLI